MLSVPSSPPPLLHVPVGGGGAEGRDGGTLGGLESPNRRGRWVSRGVAVERLLSWEEGGEMGWGEERWSSSWI